MVDYEAIAETLNSINESANDRYTADGNYIVRDVSNKDHPISHGVRFAAVVLENHGAVCTKTMYFPEESNIRLWFKEMETEEITYTETVHTV